MIFSPVGSSFSSFFLGIVLFECHLLDEKWRVARDWANFIASRTYSVLLITETETQNGKHRLKAFIDFFQCYTSLIYFITICSSTVETNNLILTSHQKFLKIQTPYLTYGVSKVSNWIHLKSQISWDKDV